MWYAKSPLHDPTASIQHQSTNFGVSTPSPCRRLLLGDEINCAEIE